MLARGRQSRQSGVMRTLHSWTVRALAIVVVTLSALPVHWLLLVGSPGTEIDAAVARADQRWLSGWLLAVPTVVAAMLLARIAPRLIDGAAARVHRRFAELSGTRFAIGAGVLAFGMVLVIRWIVLNGHPLLIDTHTQLLHARYIAEGFLAAPRTPFDAAWQPPLGIVTERGWASQYPPGQLLILAGALLTGTLPLVGAGLQAAAVVLIARIAEHAGTWRLPLRAAAILYALSPMALIHAAALLSSSSAAAFILLGAYAAIRADGRARWTALAGAAVGCVAITRPFSAITLALPTVAAVLVWRRRRPTTREWLAGAAGLMPFLVLLGFWNAALFGSPFLLGYTAAQGAAHGLGFHRDPWGYMYGPLQALGYTAADLIGLSRHMLETSLPLVPAIGVAYLGRRAVSRFELGVWVLALLPVAGLFFYWHHPDAPGPRLLGEAVPVWCILASLAATRFVKHGSVKHRTIIALSLLGAIVLVPLRMRDYRAQIRALTEHAEFGEIENAIVFVHGPWIERAAMRLAALGTRADIVQAAARHSSTCRLETVANELEAGRTPPVLVVKPDPPFPIVQRSGLLAEVRFGVHEPFPEACAMNLQADEYATVPAVFSTWRHDLPNLKPRTGVVVLRDLGPERNERAMRAWPGRTPYLAFLDEDGRTVVLPYEEGMRRVWRGKLSAPPR